MNYQPSPQSAQQEQNEVLETAFFARELGLSPESQEQPANPLEALKEQLPPTAQKFLDEKLPNVLDALRNLPEAGSTPSA